MLNLSQIGFIVPFFVVATLDRSDFVAYCCAFDKFNLNLYVSYPVYRVILCLSMKGFYRRLSNHYGINTDMDSRK